MDMPVISITSNDLIAIDQPFKVGAGPGAGKTYWLIQHINQVLQQSKKMGAYRKIACITYTNIAVETILGRLNNAVDRVEVSTIHSFLYTNIIKPYMHFIAKDYDFEVWKMDGHDDPFVSRTIVKEWLAEHPNKANFTAPWLPNQLIRIDKNYRALNSWLSSIYFKFNGTNLEIAIDNREAYDRETNNRLSKANCLDKLEPGLMDYKKAYWKNGTLHHDDVLFFGYLLIQKYPFILTVLRAKFPYFFIDEFQDTSPIQTEIIKLLAQQDTVVGIIGDKAQSIYSFQGAAPNDFDTFSLIGQAHYLIPNNRRSSNSIVSLLNHLRRDITQNGERNVLGVKPVLIVGTKENAFAYAKGICGQETLITLSRKNDTVDTMQRQYNRAIPAVNLMDELYAKDNYERFKVIKASIAAVELGREKRFKEAIKEMEKNFYTTTNKTQRKKTAFQHLSTLLSQYESYKDQPLFNFYQLVKAFRPDIPAVSTGGIKAFYDSYTFSAVAIFIDLEETDQESRTIHKAKGDEFDNVLVILEDKKYLTTPNLADEEHRVRYVAFSRAKERLFINIPELDPASDAGLSPLFQIVR